MAGLTRTSITLDNLVTVITNANFVKTDVIKAVIPSGSRAIQELMGKVVRGNSTIVVAPRGEPFSKRTETSQRIVTKYNAPIRFRINVYSRFFNTTESEDIVAIYDNLLDLLHNNRCELLNATISDAIYIWNNDNYYEAQIDIQINKLYPNN